MTTNRQKSRKYRRRSKRSQLAKRLGYHAFMLLGRFVRLLPRPASVAIARFLGELTYSVLRIRRSLVERNLALTFPEKSPQELRRLARAIYRNQAENVIEVLRLPLVRTRADAEALVDIDFGEFLATTKQSGKGGVIVSAHFGNWELLGHCFGLLVTPVTIVVKRLRNPEIDRQINVWRSLGGNTMVYKRKALREGLRTLRNGGIITLLADQSDPEEGFFTDFLGRRTSVFLGPAFLALKTGAPLFVGMNRRIGGGRYRVELTEIPTDDLGATKQDVEELVGRYTRAMEEYIRRYPEEWFWLHNRWKRG